MLTSCLRPACPWYRSDRHPLHPVPRPTGTAVRPSSQCASESQRLCSGFGCHVFCDSAQRSPWVGMRSPPQPAPGGFGLLRLLLSPSCSSGTAPGSPRLSVTACRLRDPGLLASASTSTTQRQENDERQVIGRAQRQETGEAPDSAWLSIVARERPGAVTLRAGPRRPAAPRPPSALLGVPTPSRVPCGPGSQGRPPPCDVAPSPALSLSSRFGRRCAVPSGTTSSVWRRHTGAQHEPPAGHLLRWLGDDRHGHRSERDRGPGRVLCPL